MYFILKYCNKKPLLWKDKYKGGFFMVICVSQELEYIQDELIKRGYTVINNRDNNTSCEAIICNLKNGGLANLNKQNNIKREGTLIIDSGSKSIDEIEYILSNRVYTTII